MPFPDNLRRLRLGQFLSQAELARRSDLHTLTISRLETGRAKPSTRSVRALADALRARAGACRRSSADGCRVGWLAAADTPRAWRNWQNTYGARSRRPPRPR